MRLATCLLLCCLTAPVGAESPHTPALPPDARQALLTFLRALFPELRSTGPQTYYVAPGGLDTGTCTQQAPCQTFSAALAKMVGGDTLLVRAGTYAQTLDVAATPIPSGASWETATQIRAYPGEAVTLKRGSIVVSAYGSTTYTYIVFGGFILDGERAGHTGMFIAGPQAHHIRVEDTEVKGFLHQGVQGYDTHHIEYLRLKVHHNGQDRLMHGVYIAYRDGLIDGGEFYENSGYGIQIYNSACMDACTADTIVRNTYVHHNHGDGGVTLNHGERLRFYNNVVANNTGDGVAVSYGNPQGVQVMYNTITGNTGTAVNIMESASGTLLRNNIVWGNSAAITNRGTGTVQDHNLTTDPLFVAAPDYHLRAGSPAIDTGAAVQGVTTDLEGTTRPQGAGVDIGAYERAGTPPVPPEPPASGAHGPLACTGDVLAAGKLTMRCVPEGGS